MRAAAIKYPDLEKLHTDCVSGNLDAREELATCRHPRLVSRLERRFPYFEDDIIWDSATDSILAYLREPGIYRDRRASLFNFLLAISVHKAISRFRSFANSPWAIHNHPGMTCLDSISDRGNGARRLEAIVFLSELSDLVDDTFEDPRERELIDHLLQGQCPIVTVLEIFDLRGVGKQLRARRIKDRLKRRLQRKVKAFEPGGSPEFRSRRI